MTPAALAPPFGSHVWVSYWTFDGGGGTGGGGGGDGGPQVEPHKQRVPRSQRGGEVIEPMLSTQWFLSMQGMADQALAAVESGGGLRSVGVCDPLVCHGGRALLNPQGHWAEA